MKDKRPKPRFHIIKNFWNIMDDKDSKSFQREKDDFKYKGLGTRITQDYSVVIMEAKRQWNDTFNKSDST